MNNVQSTRKQDPISLDTYRYPDSFDFEAWASQVKRQMIACLRKRGAV